MSKVHNIVTERITEVMAQGIIPWRKPWNVKCAPPCNYAGNRYKGMNFFLLSMLGFDTPIFLTYNQIVKLGGKIRDNKKQAHVPVFFWKWLKKEDEATGDETTVPIFRYFRVWNIADVEGVDLPAWYIREQGERETREHNPIAACEKIIAGYVNGPTIKHGRTFCGYDVAADECHMVDPANFVGDAEYYAALFHEELHSTGHAGRLNRKEITDPVAFADHAYSLEELVAELGAAFLCSEAGIANDALLSNTAAYLNSWIKALNDQPTMFAIAAQRAQKGADHILGRMPEKIVEED
jgi:antirestriction protein ArdC